MIPNLIGIIPDWVDDAACGRPDIDPEIFFPHSGDHDTRDKAKRICAGCQVREACATYAVTNGESHGIWGGLTGNVRARLRPKGPRRPRNLGRPCRRCAAPVFNPRGDFCGEECRTAHRREYALSYARTRKAAS